MVCGIGSADSAYRFFIKVNLCETVFTKFMPIACSDANDHPHVFCAIQERTQY